MYLAKVYVNFQLQLFMFILPQLPRLPPHIDSVLVPPVYSLATVILLLLFNHLLF
jgi:hypothetical protein